MFLVRLRSFFQIADRFKQKDECLFFCDQDFVTELLPLTAARQLAPPSISLFTKLKLIYLTRKMECSTLHQNCLASDLPKRRQCSQKKEIFQRNVWAIFGND